MTKSRIAPGLLLLSAAGPAGAQAADIDSLIQARRGELRTALRLDCPPAGDDGEIVVCGNVEEDRRYRVDPTVQASPRGADRAGGEQRAALAIDSSRCTAVGRDQRCTSGLDVIGIGFAIARAVGQALANRD